MMTDRARPKVPFAGVASRARNRSGRSSPRPLRPPICRRWRRSRWVMVGPRRWMRPIIGYGPLAFKRLGSRYRPRRTPADERATGGGDGGRPPEQPRRPGDAPRLRRPAVRRGRPARRVHPGPARPRGRVPVGRAAPSAPGARGCPARRPRARVAGGTGPVAARDAGGATLPHRGSTQAREQRSRELHAGAAVLPAHVAARVAGPLRVLQPHGGDGPPVRPGPGRSTVTVVLVPGR